MNTTILETLLGRYLPKNRIGDFSFKLTENDDSPDWFQVSSSKGQVQVEGNSLIALARGCYHYLYQICNCIIQWSGSSVKIPEIFPDYEFQVKSPYQYRYYYNVVTFGYTHPYWDWNRWEQEIEWMVLHGINMPLALIATEAILDRVFRKIGLTDEEIDEYFTGPAHLPWNRMGNIVGWDGPLSQKWHQGQIELQHKILNRMKKWGMTPITSGFAGFVPPGIKRLFPDIEFRSLRWGGFKKQYRAKLLSPTDPIFKKLGTMFVQEWEAEFGKNQHYLADSFNEMNVPVSRNPSIALQELSNYGLSVYESIRNANPDAVWVIQGWTFPFHKQGSKLFWTPERVKALFSKIPDDKVIILDLANDYNLLWWKIEGSWKIYSGFFGKQWIFSYIPNMGGKTPLNGVLDVYASQSIKALEYEHRGNLIGFGFAPEGIENNEVIYELLSDMAWTSEEINLDSWIEKYCINRYGAYPTDMKKAWDLLRKSCYGSFSDHPRHLYQFRHPALWKQKVHDSNHFNEAVKLYIGCSNEFGNNPLYVADAIELGIQFIGNQVDKKIRKVLSPIHFHKKQDLEYITDCLKFIDRVLESHPLHRLKRWIKHARHWGNTEEEKNQYEANAKRLITSWGGHNQDYAARVWSGLIRDFYIPRFEIGSGWKSLFSHKKLLKMEEDWINSPGISKIEPYEEPLVELIEKIKSMESN